MASEKTVAQVLSEAADIVERGWCQDYMSSFRDGVRCYCAVGAIEAVSRGGAADAEGCLARVVCPSVKPWQAGWWIVAQWNDAHCRTQAEVVAAMREAARLAEQEAATHGV